MKNRKIRLIGVLCLSAFFLLGGCGSDKDSSESMDVVVGLEDMTTEPEAPERVEDPVTEQSGEALGAEEESPEEPKENGAEIPALNEIYEEIKSQVELVSPMLVPEDFIDNYYGIDVSAVEEYIFSMSEASISAEMIVLMKCEESQREDFLEALSNVADLKADEMESYLPEQYRIVQDARLENRGAYIYLVISEKADEIQSILDGYLGQ